MGNPQPLNTLEQKNPSFEPRISKAMRIQRVLLPDKQQFIKNLLCYAAGDMYEVTCGFVYLLHNIPTRVVVCVACMEKCRFLRIFPIYFVAKIEKKRYNDTILTYVLANMLCNLTEKGDAEGNNFIYGYLK